MSDTPLKPGDRIEVRTGDQWEAATVDHFFDSTTKGQMTLAVLFDVPRQGWSYRTTFIVEACRVRPMKADRPLLVPVGQPA